jgi:hypothetical protein
MIRKLKIQIACKERELRGCAPRSRDRIRVELKALVVALEIARQTAAEKRRAA